MKVTIECSNEGEAKLALNGAAFLTLIEEYDGWLEGAGREANAPEIRAKWASLLHLNGIKIL